MATDPASSTDATGGTRIDSLAHHLTRRDALFGIALTLVGLVTVWPTLQRPAPWRVWYWVLFGGVAAGIDLLGWTLLDTDRWNDRRLVSLLGVTLVTLSTLGLTVREFSVTEFTGEVQWYLVAAGVSGTAWIVGSVLLGRRRWSERPRYVTFGILTGLWLAYPVYVPEFGTQNPLGYLLVVLVPVGAGYLAWRDLWDSLADVLARPWPRRIGTLVALGFTAFFLSFKGMVRLGTARTGSPEIDIRMIANPLVEWPGIEVFSPRYDVFMWGTIGVAIVIGTLAALIGLNAALSTRLFQYRRAGGGSATALGALATTGSAVSGCCAPPILLSLFGGIVGSTGALTAAFVSPASPLGELFFVGAATLLVGNSLRTSRLLGDTCEA